MAGVDTEILLTSVFGILYPSTVSEPETVRKFGQESTCVIRENTRSTDQ
jgi:hypothetical protein